MRNITILVSGVLVVALSSAETFACSCACDAGYTVENYIDYASVIIVGRVLEVRDKAPDPASDPLSKQFAELTGVDPKYLTVISSCGGRWVRVAVETQLKGERRTEMSLSQEAVGTACDLPFPLVTGESYLLFGMSAGEGGALQIAGCAPSSRVEQSEQMIDRIRKQLAAAS